MIPPTPEQIAELKAKHSNKLRMVTIDDNSDDPEEADVDYVVVRAPKLAEYDRFTKTNASGDSGQAAAMKELAYTCAVYPERAEFQLLLERKPFAILQIADAAAEMGGLKKKAKVEKL